MGASFGLLLGCSIGAWGLPREVLGSRRGGVLRIMVLLVTFRALGGHFGPLAFLGGFAAPGRKRSAVSAQGRGGTLEAPRVRRTPPQTSLGSPNGAPMEPPPRRHPIFNFASPSRSSFLGGAVCRFPLPSHGEAPRCRTSKRHGHGHSAGRGHRDRAGHSHGHGHEQNVHMKEKDT